MRLAFCGTPEFAVPALEAVCAADHQIACVYTQPPRAAGRGKRARRSRVHEFAAARGLEVRTPATFKDADAVAAFTALALDAAVVAAYGLILPPPILDAPRYGCINIHASLLPRWRGAAPIERALLAGDAETGITVMAMDEGLDTGPELAKEAVPIGPHTTSVELRDRLATLGARMIVDALTGLADGTLAARPQAEEGACYAAKLARDEGRIDWSRPAVELERQVRALTPWPGCWFAYAGERIKITAATVKDGDGVPGTVLDDVFTVACGGGALRADRLQRAGRGELATAALLRGFAIPAGTVLD